VRGSRLAHAPGRVHASGRGHSGFKANRAKPQGEATILTIPGRTAIVGGEIITISPRLAACIARMRDGGLLRSGEADAITRRRRR
jgi:hypothetical protein